MKNLKETLKKINFLTVAQWALTLVIMIMPFWGVAHADLAQPNCQALGGVNCTTGDAKSIIITVLNYALGFAFLIAVVMLVFGGFRYMTSAGNEEMAGKGKKTIINALIGIVVIILSYVIVSVISRTVSNVGTSTP